jgi:hypothetical protein
MPQHAKASQQDADEAAKAAELDISRATATISFFFIEISSWRAGDSEWHAHFTIRNEPS